MTECVSPGGILKETIVRAEHLVGEKEEPLASQSAIVQTRLPRKFDVESRVEASEGLHVCHHSETVLKDMLAANWELQEVGGSGLEEEEREREKAERKEVINFSKFLGGK